MYGSNSCEATKVTGITKASGKFFHEKLANVVEVNLQSWKKFFQKFSLFSTTFLHRNQIIISRKQIYELPYE